MPARPRRELAAPAAPARDRAAGPGAVRSKAHGPSRPHRSQPAAPPHACARPCRRRRHHFRRRCFRVGDAAQRSPYRRVLRPRKRLPRPGGGGGGGARPGPAERRGGEACKCGGVRGPLPGGCRRGAVRGPAARCLPGTGRQRVWRLSWGWATEVAALRAVTPPLFLPIKACGKSAG